MATRFLFFLRQAGRYLLHAFLWLFLLLWGLLLYNLPFDRGPVAFRPLLEQAVPLQLISYQAGPAAHPSPVVCALRDGGQDTTVLFIHGSPGSGTDFAPYLADSSLFARARLATLDRPGFGLSAGSGALGLAEQSRRLGPLVAYLRARGPLILAGHSLGGPLAVRLAMDYPQQVDGLVLLAAALDPALEEMAWYNELLDLRAVQWMMPDALVYSNREIQGLKQDLEDMLPRYHSLRQPIVLVQGGADELVSPSNADFARFRLSHLPIVWDLPPQVGHLFPFDEPQRVRQAVHRSLHQLGVVHGPPASG
ncbi:MAG: alpha/beta hydrolase [Bacteroidetes bacterium]|nr:alpha/beta hydrolase [Bacteroidota bacterium]